MWLATKCKIGNISFLQVLVVTSIFVIPYAGKTVRPEPNTPGKFIIWFRNETALLVLWQPPYTARIFTHYKVSIEPPDAIENVLNVEKGGEPLDPAQAAFKGLVPGRAYNISVDTVSEDEISLLATAQYRTVPLRPMNVTVDKDSITSNSFRVLWEAPKDVTEFDNYQVSLGRSPPSTVQRTNDPFASFDFSDVSKPGKTVTVVVKTASGRVTSGPATSVVTLRPLPVENLIYFNDDKINSVKISWDTDPASTQDEYRIVYHELDTLNGDGSNFTTVLTYFNLEQLLPGRNYSLSVQALSKKTESKETTIYIGTKPSSPITESDVNSMHKPIEVLQSRNGNTDTRTAFTEESRAVITKQHPALNACTADEWNCGDGQCIDKDFLCNGEVNCNDGSDESDKLCDTQNQRGIERLSTRFSLDEIGAAVTSTPPPTPTLTPTIISKMTTPNGCRLPTETELIVTDIFERPVELRSVVPPNAIVKFACQRGFTLTGILTSFCTGNEWNDPLPTCHKFCSTSSLKKGLSTVLTCERDGGMTKCTDTVPPKTVARIGCAIGFVRQTDAETRLRCESHGHWSYPRTKCRMQCGRVAPPTTKFSRGGHPISILEVPWHVGIYINFGGTFKHICGGTIISPRLVVSAAHCFWSETSSKLNEKKYYKIVAGKYYRDYEKEKELYQASAIEDIILEEPYNDRARNYRNDIAVLRLETALKFSALVSPVCIRFEKNANKEVETGTIGKFAGWGITANLTAAEELQGVTMTAISNSDCKKQLRQYGNYELPDDKFCLMDEFGKSACRGDSGGGYVWSERISGTTTHYLIGIISHAPAKEQDCAVDGVVALTNVNYFERLIENARDEETEEF